MTQDRLMAGIDFAWFRVVKPTFIWMLVNVLPWFIMLMLFAFMLSYQAELDSPFTVDIAGAMLAGALSYMALRCGTWAWFGDNDPFDSY